MVDFYQQQLSNRMLKADDRATYSEITRWILVSSLLVGLILSYAWSHNEILNIQYQMEQLRGDNNELGELNTALRAEHFSLVNPETIDQQAKKLGLISSNRMEVKVLDSDIPTSRPSQNLVAQSTLRKKTLHE
jgi:hypothetical protein